MLSYGFSIKGKAHIKTGVVCQDANMHGEIAPGLYIGVAADGVGSARHSDIASGLATEKLVKYLENHIQSDYSVEEKMACLKAGYRYAEKAIEEYVKDCDDMLNEYDTTLHVVLYGDLWSCRRWRNFGSDNVRRDKGSHVSTEGLGRCVGHAAAGG